tara:strand:+ start:294 stop:920 length:627 start_codon:yes stop_codon:yes gene_type:complete
MIWDIILGFDKTLLITFVLAAYLLIITPGADFIFVSGSGVVGGPYTEIAAGVGVRLGVLVHALAAAAGVSAALLVYPTAYDAIGWVGAIYLAWVAIQAWRSDGRLAPGRVASGAMRAMKRGFVTNVLNPKTALFIFAFIPQFTDPEIGPIWLQILLLGTIFLLYGLFFVMCLGAVLGYFAFALRERVKILNKLTAILFGGLAARLIID